MMQNLLSMRTALTLQLSYIGMSIFWNLVGVGLIDAGLKPLGPVANMQTVYLLLAVGIALSIASQKAIWLYAALSALLAFGAISALYGSVTGAPDMWPSAYFRWFGALINIAGLLAFALATYVTVKDLTARRP